VTLGNTESFDLQSDDLSQCDDYTQYTTTQTDVRGRRTRTGAKVQHPETSFLTKLYRLFAIIFIMTIAITPQTIVSY
jgi:hypothetical protein